MASLIRARPQRRAVPPSPARGRDAARGAPAARARARPPSFTVAPASGTPTQGDRDRAIRHAIGARDIQRASRARVERFAARGEPRPQGGRSRTGSRCSATPSCVATPLLAVARASAQLASGQDQLAEHWAGDGRGRRLADARARRGRASASSARRWRATGSRAWRDDAERGVRARARGEPAAGDCPPARRHGGPARGRDDEAVRQLQEGARRAAVTAPDVHALCLTQLALAAIAEEDWEEATELVTRARAQVERYGLAAYPTAALVFATSALVRAHRGRVEAAQQDFQTARRLQGADDRRRRLVRGGAGGRAREDRGPAERSHRRARAPDRRQPDDASGPGRRALLAAWLDDSWAQLDAVLGHASAPRRRR